MFKPARLTRHATQIARMARDGLSNPEIGARLLIQLDRVLSDDPPLLPT
jgi:DNA-binding NarL/FixJ family response regulator